MLNDILVDVQMDANDSSLLALTDTNGDPYLTSLSDMVATYYSQRTEAELAFARQLWLAYKDLYKVMAMAFNTQYLNSPDNSIALYSGILLIIIKRMTQLDSFIKTTEGTNGTV